MRLGIGEWLGIIGVITSAVAYAVTLRSDLNHQREDINRLREDMVIFRGAGATIQTNTEDLLLMFLDECPKGWAQVEIFIVGKSPGKRFAVCATRNSARKTEAPAR
jgi:hypothetical protein